jgi:hypothetical protein
MIVAEALPPVVQRRRPPRRGWRGPRYEGEIPTLGYAVLDWMTGYLASPRDETQPFMPTDEQAQRILLWYALHPETGRFIYRRWLQQRAKGWGKSPLVGAIMLAGLGAANENDSAPVLFDGWDAAGEPVGRPWGTGGHPPAWVQIAAVSEDQTDNTYSAIYQMLTANDHRAARLLGIDDGLTRLFLRGRPGKLEPVTASAGSREGQPITDAVLDETHLYNAHNGGTKLARTIRRNAAKMNSRTIETANAPILGEESVAERSLRAAQSGAPGILLDMKRPVLEPDARWDDERLLAALGEAYGDSWWVDLHRLVADIRDPDMPWEDALRFFFNIPTAGVSRAVDPRSWDSLAMPREVPPGTPIGVGFDGSDYHDATVLRGCTRFGYTFTLGRWSRPPGATDWSVPRVEVMQRIHEVHGYYRVGKMLCDPPRWWTEIQALQELYGEEVVLAFDTNQARRMTTAVDRWLTAIRSAARLVREALAAGETGPLLLPYSHDGDEFTTEQVKATRLRKVNVTEIESDRTLYMLEKDGIVGNDSTVADVLALEAAMTMAEPEPEVEPAILFGAAR